MSNVANPGNDFCVQTMKRTNASEMLSSAKRAAFNTQSLARMTRHQHVVVIGDSNAYIFRSIMKHRLIPAVRFSICSVGGATAQGLANPNSRTDAFKIFAQRVAAAPPWQPLVFVLGEVDCGFVIWYRAEKHGISVEEQLHRSIDNYVAFLSPIGNAGRRVLVLSTPLPTILDGQDWGEVANVRREVTASMRDRADLTIEFNELLAEAARSHPFAFVDVTTGHTNPDTHLVDQRFLNPDPLDHHLADAPFGQLVAQQLGPLLRQGVGALP